MKRKKALYEDVVSAEPDTKSKSDDKGKSSESKDSEAASPSESGNKSDTQGKDESSHTAISKRAERLAEDPFMTQAEMKAMDGGTKEKQEQVDKNSDENPNSKRRREVRETEKELDIIASRADKTLFHAKALFPFDFFPNTMTIDANKVNIIIRTFFWTETVTSILLKEIMDVRVETALFLGKLIIDYGPHPLKIRTVYVASLWKSDALKAKEIIEGHLVLYRSENIDTAKIRPFDETIEEIQEVGKVEEERP